jgi:ABC-type lipoprotein export system ATPase subunit
VFQEYNLLSGLNVLENVMLRSCWSRTTWTSPARLGGQIRLKDGKLLSDELVKVMVPA